MKLYLVERYGEDRNGNTTWRHPVGLYKDKGNAALSLLRRFGANANQNELPYH